ncbi:hypothetical protein AB6F89_22905 [Providencia hangzhouensis]|uniref:hypothetical protein n=1 Tax=Providencia hangzhouensis TaxID=3031799 RepID=UPI0034DCE64E
MNLTTITGKLSGGNGEAITYTKYNLRMSGGGLTTSGASSAVCQTPVTVNGYTGTAAVIGRSDIVVGVTGTSSGAKVNINTSTNGVKNKTKIYSIDGVWDSQGKLSSSTASAASLASNCLYPAAAPAGGDIFYGGAANPAIGNVPATLNLTLWAYISPTVPYGTYNLTQLFFNQGTATVTESLIASKQILYTGDRLIVQAPPCTISVGNNSVVFDNLSTSPTVSASVSDALSINCGSSSVSASAYIRATAITGTATTDGYGLGLINNETNKSNIDGTGIIVRGELGSSPTKNCSAGNPASSVLFNPSSTLAGYKVMELSGSSSSASVPVQWYACTTNNTLPGNYSGAVTLGIVYR